MKNQSRKLRLAIAMLLFLFSFSTYAQFVNINIEIPSKIGQTLMMPLELYLKTDVNTGRQIFSGKGILSITGDENFQVLVSLTHSDSLIDNDGVKVPFKVDLAYRNDGIDQLPGLEVNKSASFPLSNAGKIIENMRNSTNVLNAYLFINANTGQLINKKTTYVGDINLKIECN